MKKTINKTIHIIREKYFILLSIILFIFVIVFNRYIDFVLPFSLLSLTIYYLISFYTTCPNCDRPFSKKIIDKKVVHQHIEFTEKDMDYYDTIYTEKEKDFKCRHCGHAWKKLKETNRRQ